MATRSSDDDALANVKAIAEKSPRDVARLYGRLLLHAQEVIDEFREGEEHDTVLCAACADIKANVDVLRGYLR